jgi:SRSO17 transposase
MGEDILLLACSEYLKTKSQLALEMIRAARAKRIRFAWVGVDGGYGKESGFLSALDNDNGIFMANVHKDQHIYFLASEEFSKHKGAPQ